MRNRRVMLTAALIAAWSALSVWWMRREFEAARQARTAFVVATQDPATVRDDGEVIDLTTSESEPTSAEAAPARRPDHQPIGSVAGVGVAR